MQLNKTVLAGGVVYPAGTPATPELRERIQDAAHWSESGEAAPTDAPEAPNYGGMKLDELQAEADKRGLEVEGSGKDGNVLKADLVSALEADDGA